MQLERRGIWKCEVTPSCNIASRRCVQSMLDQISSVVGILPATNILNFDADPSFK